MACSTSGPAVTRLPFSSYRTPAENPSFPYFQAFVAFTANRLGTWAGIAYDGGNEFAIVTWRSGQPLHVLDRFAYTSTSFDTVADYGSVAVVGILPSGGVVAAVQPTTADYDGPRIGLVYLSGHRYQLRGSPRWQLVKPVGVTSSGAIIGWVNAYDVHHQLRHAVVRWASPVAAPTTVVSTGLESPYPAVDRHGDIAYHVGDLTKVVLASGQTRTLGGLPGALNHFAWVGDGGSTIYGTSDSETSSGAAVVAWPLADPPAAGPIPPHQLTGPGAYTQPMAVGPNGRVLNGYAVPSRMRTPAGGYPRLPAILPVDTGLNPGESIDQYGTVAFTSRSDGLVHFLRCP
ncbi:MAG: hypothetical protein QOH14_999 [Pseudonocardiales bacterium]|nr:hypothetical protein [Pseudonocardiales bacterium]